MPSRKRRMRQRNAPQPDRDFPYGAKPQNRMTPPAQTRTQRGTSGIAPGEPTPGPTGPSLPPRPTPTPPQFPPAPVEQYAAPTGMPTEPGWYWDGGSWRYDPNLAALGITNASDAWDLWRNESGRPFNQGTYEGALQDRQSFKDALREQGIMDEFRRWRREQNLRGAQNFDEAIMGFGAQQARQGREPPRTNPGGYVTGYYDDPARGQAYQMGQFDYTAPWTGSYAPINTQPRPDQPLPAPSPVPPDRPPPGGPGQPPPGPAPPTMPQAPQVATYPPDRPPPTGPGQPPTGPAPPPVPAPMPQPPPVTGPGWQPPPTGPAPPQMPAPMPTTPPVTGPGWQPPPTGPVPPAMPPPIDATRPPPYQAPFDPYRPAPTGPGQPPTGPAPQGLAPNGSQGFSGPQTMTMAPPPSYPTAAPEGPSTTPTPTGPHPVQVANETPDEQLGLPLSPEFEAARRALEDELAATLASIGMARDQIQPTVDLVTQRLATDQIAAERSVNESLNAAGRFGSGYNQRALADTGLGYDRQRQDLATSAAQQYSELSQAELEAQTSFQKALNDLLLQLANQEAQNERTPVDVSGEHPEVEEPKDKKKKKKKNKNTKSSGGKRRKS